MRRLTITLIGSAISVLSAVSQGLAQTPPASSKSVEELFAEGVAASNQQDWPKALASLSAAWAKKKHWKIAANLGRAELKSEKYCESREHIKYFLREAPDLSAGDREQAEELIRKAEAEVGLLTINVNIDGADVIIGGEAVGRSPLTEPECLHAGKRSIEVKREGYTSGHVIEDIRPRSAGSVEINLLIRKPEMLKGSTSDTLFERLRHRGPWLVAIGSLAVAATAIGVGFRLDAKSADNAANAMADQLIREVPPGNDVCAVALGKNRPDKCSAYQSEISRRDNDRRAANGTFAASASLLVGGVAVVSLLPLSHHDPTITGILAIPEITPTRQGLTVMGSF